MYTKDNFLVPDPAKSSDLTAFYDLLDRFESKYGKRGDKLNAAIAIARYCAAEMVLPKDIPFDPESVKETYHKDPLIVFADPSRPETSAEKFADALKKFRNKYGNRGDRINLAIEAAMAVAKMAIQVDDRYHE